ncbi:helix-turn-helix transcriptional regulator [Methylobacterium sp. A49B]
MPKRLIKSCRNKDRTSVMINQAQNVAPIGCPDLPASGFVRLSQITGLSGPIPVSRSTLYAWIQAGLFPSPVHLGPGRIAGFRVEDGGGLY